MVYLFVLSKNDFGVAFPILGALGFLVLPLVGWLTLNETVTLGRIVGTIIIVAGMLIVARGELDMSIKQNRIGNLLVSCRF